MDVLASIHSNPVLLFITQALVPGRGGQTLCWCMSGGCSAMSQYTPCGAFIRLPLGGYRPALVRSSNSKPTGAHICKDQAVTDRWPRHYWHAFQCWLVTQECCTYSTTRFRLCGASSSEAWFLVAEDPLPPLRLTFYINLVACVALATCVSAPQAALRGLRIRHRGGGSSAAHAPVIGLRGVDQVATAGIGVCTKARKL